MRFVFLSIVLNFGFSKSVAQYVEWKTMSNNEQQIHFLIYNAYIKDFDRLKLKGWIDDFKKETEISFFFDGDTILNINENDSMHIKLKLALCSNRFPYTARVKESTLKKHYRQSGRYFFNPDEVGIDNRFVFGNISNQNLIAIYENYYGIIDVSNISFKNGKFNGKIVCVDSVNYSNNRRLHLCVNDWLITLMGNNDSRNKVFVLNVDRWFYFYTYFYNKGFRLTKGVFKKYIDAKAIPAKNTTQSTTE